MNGRVVVGIVLVGAVAGCSAAAPTSTTELSDDAQAACRRLPRRWTLGVAMKEKDP
jgi:uncharacterized lipoprotein